MTTNYHIPITTGAAANASIVNSPLSDLDTALTAEINARQGGAAVEDQVLKQWTEAEAYEMTSITCDADGIILSATVKWPDGSGGTFTRTTKNATWLAIDAYTITHTASSSTITQTTVTRNASGQITAKPALTVA
jgi:hypothetical protein